MPIVKDEDRQEMFVPNDNPFTTATQQETLEKKSGVFETIGAAWSNYNPVTSLVVGDATLSIFDDVDRDYNPYDDMSGFEEYSHILVNAKDATHMGRLKNDITRKQKNDRILQNSGAKGVAFSLASGILDPISTVPILGSASKTATTLRNTSKMSKAQKAAGNARAAGVVGAEASLSVGASELVLQATQPTLEASESLFAMSAGAFLGGTMGSAAEVLSRRKFNKLANSYRQDVKEAFLNPDASLAKTDDGIIKAYNATAKSGGAQAVPKLTKEDLELVNTFGFAKLTRFMTPTLRVMQSQSEKAREIYAKMAEIPLKLQGSQSGKTMYVSAERAQKVLMDKTIGKGKKALDSGYKEYSKSAKQRGQQRLNRAEFNKRVSSALRRGDVDDMNDLEITRVARALRKEVFEPLKDEAISVGLLPEDIEAKFADSYLTRIWNPKEILDKQDLFQGKLADHLTKKVEETISNVESKYSGMQKRIDKSIAKEKEMFSLLQNRIDELEKIGTKFTYTKLSAVQDDFLEALKRDIGLENVEAYISQNGLEDIASMVNTALIKTPKLPQGLASEIVKRGGVQDVDGVLAQYGINNKSRVGLITNTGKHPDDMLRELMDEGFFPELRVTDGSPEVAVPDDLYLGIVEDMNGAGVFRDVDLDDVLLHDQVRDMKEEAELLLNSLGFGDYKKFYKFIKDDVKAKRKKLRKDAMLERIRIKGAKEAGREAQKATKDMRKELARLKNREKALLNREIRKTETRIKKREAKKEDIELRRNAELDGFYDVDGGSVSQYVGEMVDEITDTLTGSLTRFNQELPSYASPFSRGPLKEKLLDVNDIDFEDFLENDIETIMNYYGRNMTAQIEMKRVFPDGINLEKEIADIEEEYNGLIKALPDGDKGRNKLKKERDRTIEDIRGVRDIIQGTYNKADPDSMWNAALTSLRDLQFMRSMGGVTLSSFPDIFRPIAVNGTQSFFDGMNFAKASRELQKATLEELEDASFLFEALTANRLDTLAEIGDPLGRGTALTRFTGNASTVFSKVTMINYWNDIMKAASGLSTNNRVLKNVEAMSKGDIDPNELAYMRELGFDDLHSNVILKQFKKHGKTEGGLRTSGKTKWDLSDPNVKEAKRVLDAALKREGDISIVTKSAGDIPLFANTPLGRLLMQFRTFVVASHSRVFLRSLQARGNKEITGVAMASLGQIMMGMGVSAIKQEQANRSREKRGAARKEVSDWNLAKWISEGVDRSGLIALMMEPVNISDKLFGLGPSMFTGEEQTRFQTRGAFGSIFGPSVGTVEDMAFAGRALLSPLTGADVNSSDINKIRRLMPFQNAFIFRKIFDELEAAANE